MGREFTVLAASSGLAVRVLASGMTGGFAIIYSKKIYIVQLKTQKYSQTHRELRVGFTSEERRVTNEERRITNEGRRVPL